MRARRVSPMYPTEQCIRPRAPILPRCAFMLPARFLSRTAHLRRRLSCSFLPASPAFLPHPPLHLDFLPR